MIWKKYSNKVKLAQWLAPFESVGNQTPIKTEATHRHIHKLFIRSYSYGRLSFTTAEPWGLWEINSRRYFVFMNALADIKYTQTDQLPIVIITGHQLNVQSIIHPANPNTLREFLT